MAQHIAVINYQPAWPRQFADEAARIRRILGDNCVTIHHIGSTAVPGLAAKPVIDMLPVVRELAAVDHSAAAFARIGYEYLGEFGLPGRRYLRKGGDRRTHQIHIFALGSAEIDRHLPSGIICAPTRRSAKDMHALSGPWPPGIPMISKDIVTGRMRLSSGSSRRRWHGSARSDKKKQRAAV